MTSYPKAIKRFANRTDYTEVFYAQHMNDLQDEIVAVQKILGVNPQNGIGVDGLPRVFDSIDDRLNRDGPSCIITATSAAPYNFATVDGSRRHVWQNVVTNIDGNEVTTNNVSRIPLYPGRGYMVYFEATGYAQADGFAEFELYLQRQITIKSNIPYTHAIAPQGCWVEQDCREDDPRDQGPPGRG